MNLKIIRCPSCNTKLTIDKKESVVECYVCDYEIAKERKRGKVKCDYYSVPDTENFDFSGNDFEIWSGPVLIKRKYKEKK